MRNISDQMLLNYLAFRALSDPGLVIKAASSAIPKNGAAVSYLADGEFKSLAINTDFPMTGADSQIKVPTGYTSLFVLAIKASDGTPEVFQSPTMISNTALALNTGARDANGALTTETRYKTFHAVRNEAGATVLAEKRATIEYHSDALPDVPVGYVPIGVVKVVNNTGADFVPGTTALDAASTTVTYTDLAVLPTAKNF